MKRSFIANAANAVGMQSSGTSAGAAEHCWLNAGGHWFFLPGLQCWQMGKWMLPKQDMAHVAISIRQVARLLRTLHDTFAEVLSIP